MVSRKNEKLIAFVVTTLDNKIALERVSNVNCIFLVFVVTTFLCNK